jgi:hypothetical protein
VHLDVPRGLRFSYPAGRAGPWWKLEQFADWLGLDFNAGSAR